MVICCEVYRGVKLGSWIRIWNLNLMCFHLFVQLDSQTGAIDITHRTYARTQIHEHTHTQTHTQVRTHSPPWLIYTWSTLNMFSHQAIIIFQSISLFLYIVSTEINSNQINSNQINSIGKYYLYTITCKIFYSHT